MDDQSNRYWANVRTATSTLLKGLKHTTIHFGQAIRQRGNIGIEDDRYFDEPTGLQTALYPHEILPVPDNGRYKLHNEIDDCIVCDKCAKICPVDCIDIEPVRAVEDIGITSDGTPRRIYAAKFDIDMSKCCFCGLCTTVCPTECLTMTNEYDYSEFDVAMHNFEFGNMSLVEIAEKKKMLEEHNQQKQQKANVAEATPKAGRPVFKPKVKPAAKTGAAEKNEEAIEKPKFRPKIKMQLVVKPEEKPVESEEPQTKPRFRPKVKPITKAKGEDEKPVKAKPVMQKKEEPGDEEQKPKEKPKFRPRPVVKKKNEDDK